MLKRVGEPETCIIKIRALYSTLRPSEQKVAGYILEHPQEVIYLSVTELSNRVGVSDATIIKFCQRVGYKGYQEMKIYLAKELVTPMLEIYGEITRRDDLGVVKEKIFQINAQALNDTKKILADSELERAVTAIDQAGRFHIFGLGASGGVAVDAQLKFLRIGIPTVAFTDSHNQTAFAALSTKDDAALAITNSGNTKDVVRALAVARAAGATTICLTSSPGSAVVKEAEIKLFTSATETIFRSGAIASRIAQLSVIDVLFIGVALRRYDQSLLCLAKTREAVSDKKY